MLPMGPGPCEARPASARATRTSQLNKDVARSVEVDKDTLHDCVTVRRCQHLLPASSTQRCSGEFCVHFGCRCRGPMRSYLYKTTVRPSLCLRRHVGHQGHVCRAGKLNSPTPCAGQNNAPKHFFAKGDAARCCILKVV